VLVSDQLQWDKLACCRDQLAGAPRFLAFDPCQAPAGPAPPDVLADQVAGVTEAEAAQVERLAAGAVRPDSLATIVYTSGTTGEPRGVMLSQGNLASNALARTQALGHHAGDLRLNFLPLSHIFARTCDLYTWLATGSRLALAESRQTVLADCQAIHPTVINGVPYFYKKAIRVLCERGEAGRKGALRELFGGAIRMCCSGGAALPDRVFDFYCRQEVQLLQGYGLTEASPDISVNRPAEMRKGTVGRPIPGVEVRIAEDGEILTRGPHVMIGYYKDPIATGEAIRDGWLHTGDLGELDEQGYLRVTGRKKEIIVTAGGQNVAPLLLESLLTEDPLISQALVVGDGRDYLAALIVPDLDALRNELAARHTPVACDSQMLTDPLVLSLYEQRIRERLACLSGYEQVRKFRLTARPFTIESGELTAKLSLRRRVIEANRAQEIEAMYRRV
jgi:long-chain acyl-CoA synthetase